MSYIQIIERIKDHPEVWQHKHPLFKKQYIRQKFFRRLAKELDSDEASLRKAWKYLLDQYRKEYRKISSLNKDLGEPVSSSWQYYNHLSFLSNPYTRKKKSENQPVNDNSEPDKNDDCLTQNMQEGSANNLNEEENTKNNTNNRREDRSPTISKADLILLKLQSIKCKISASNEEKKDEDYMFFQSLLPMVRTLTPLKKLQLRGKINEWLLHEFSATDPLEHTAYEMAELNCSDYEDNKLDIRK